MRNITLEEFDRFREALLAMALPSDLSEYKPIDIVGTGGDGKNTFNISTFELFCLGRSWVQSSQTWKLRFNFYQWKTSNVLEFYGAKF